jgi:acyl-CoA thioester hydrolase
MRKIAYIDNFNEWEKSFNFSITFTVRFSETDAFGHLNNTVPFTYFEDARVAMLTSINYEIDANSQLLPVVADIQCDFIKQVFFKETITLYTKINTIGNTSFEIHYMAKNEQGEICFVGRGAIVQINKETGRPHQLDDDLIKRLNTFK